MFEHDLHAIRGGDSLAKASPDDGVGPCSLAGVESVEICRVGEGEMPNFPQEPSGLLLLHANTPLSASQTRNTNVLFVSVIDFGGELCTY